LPVKETANAETDWANSLFYNRNEPDNIVVVCCVLQGHGPLSESLNESL
jgi:hypothetical protein